MTSMEGQYVFLSASFPSGSRGEEVSPYDPAAIADAVTAIVRAVLLSNGKLVFGGHPTITPLVLMIGTELRVEHAVDVYQSEWFRDKVTNETIRLIETGVGTIHWTDRFETLEESLHEMRSRMFEHAGMAGAVFVGGMSGIWLEYDQFGERLPGVPRIPVAGPGGAAAQVITDSAGISERLVDALTSRHYPFVASQIIETLALGMDA